ncbi:DNA-binding protein [Leucobacter sp. OH2974_COT-288]|uniref:DNA-binding protein n=1 Tax=Canibacter oris TaxID=1365628 RepID=A0A840DMM4_9MICO|nr:Rv2175c family DNA-binding protein [Canibacter oris]MBB4071308.1 hypothetical protein [Canibacter oris]RRD36036.1 DNA-binding protein [Leucobacter sp. OH2974_COT-288]
METAATYTVPELVEILGLTPGKVRRLLEERVLLATRVAGVLRVPQVFLQDGEPVVGLKGTAIVLLDAGLSEEEAVGWLLAENEQLGDTPIALLRKNHKAPVRAAAALLA